MVGKKTMIATIAILEAGLVMPNQLFMIGAKAIIGTELAAMAKGIVASLTMVQRDVISATRMPLPQPMMNPPNASQNVAPAASNNIELSPGVIQRFACNKNSAKIAEGFGCRNC